MQALCTLQAVSEFKCQIAQHKLRIKTCGDWAGCQANRESTSGAAMLLGQRALETRSKTQSLLALSSRESEFYAAMKAPAEGLGMMSMLQNPGYEVKGMVLGAAQRR